MHRTTRLQCFRHFLSTLTSAKIAILVETCHESTASRQALQEQIAYLLFHADQTLLPSKTCSKSFLRRRQRPGPRQRDASDTRQHDNTRRTQVVPPDCKQEPFATDSGYSNSKTFDKRSLEKHLHMSALRPYTRSMD